MSAERAFCFSERGYAMSNEKHAIEESERVKCAAEGCLDCQVALERSHIKERLAQRAREGEKQYLIRYSDGTEVRCNRTEARAVIATGFRAGLGVEVKVWKDERVM